MEKSHKKGSMRLNATNSHEAQNLTSNSTIVKQLTSSNVPLIKVNQIELDESQGLMVCDTR